MSEKLSLMRPEAVSVRPGETSVIPLMILRDNVDDSVIVKLEDLPAGVEVVNDCAIHRGHLRSSVELRVTEGAQPVADHEARVVAIGPGGETTSQPVHIAIKCKSGENGNGEALPPESRRDRPEDLNRRGPVASVFPPAEEGHPVSSIEEELGRDADVEMPIGRPLGEYAQPLDEVELIDGCEEEEDDESVPFGF